MTGHNSIAEPTENKSHGSHPRKPGRFAVTCCAALLVLLFYAPVTRDCLAGERVPNPFEQKLKAVCLYTFSHFSQWPGNNDPHATDSLVIAVVGQSPTNKAIASLQAQLKKKGKAITIVFHGPYRPGMDLSRSHLLFVCASEQKNFSRIIADLHNAPVLTVADAEGFLAAGGMIKLVVRDNRVRWEVNRIALRKAGLNVSAKLLQLAIRVLDTSRPTAPEHDPHGKTLQSLPRKAFAMLLPITPSLYESRLLGQYVLFARLHFDHHYLFEKST